MRWQVNCLLLFLLWSPQVFGVTDDGFLVEQLESAIRYFPCEAFLGVDRALLRFSADKKAQQDGLLIWADNSACYECSKQLIFNSSSDDPSTFCANVWVPFPWGLYLTTRDNVIIESITEF